MPSPTAGRNLSRRANDRTLSQNHLAATTNLLLNALDSRTAPSRRDRHQLLGQPEWGGLAQSSMKVPADTTASIANPRAIVKREFVEMALNPINAAAQLGR